MFRKHFELSDFPKDKQRTDNLQVQKQPPEVFYKKGVLKNFAKFCLRSATLLKKRLWHRCFPVNFANFLRAPF